MSGSATMLNAAGNDPGFDGYNKGWQTNLNATDMNSIGQALRDGSDLTYIRNPALSFPPRGAVMFDEPPVPPTARVRYVQPHVRLSAASSFGLAQDYLAYGFSDAEAAAGLYSQAVKVNAHVTPIQFDLPQRATPPSGNPYWTTADMQPGTLQFAFAKGVGGAKPGESDTLRIWGLSLDVVWDDQPTVAILFPTPGTVWTSSEQPTVGWQTTSDQPQGRFQLRVFAAATVAGASFNPETSPAEYDLDLLADWQQLQLSGLDRGVHYVYVRAATLPQGPTLPFWSAWASTSVDINPPADPVNALSPPMPPTIVATAEDDRARIRLNVTAGSILPQQVEEIGDAVSVGATGGSLGPQVDWGTVPDVGDMLVIHITSQTGSPNPIPEFGWEIKGFGTSYFIYRRQDGSVPRVHRFLHTGGATGWTVTGARRFKHVDPGKPLRFLGGYETFTGTGTSAAPTTTQLAAAGDLVLGGMAVVPGPTTAPLDGDWVGNPVPVLGASGIFEWKVALAGVQAWHVTWGPSGAWRSIQMAMVAAPAPRPAEYITIQESLDGGATWATVRGADRVPLSGNEVVWWATEVPNKADAVYRARAINDDPGYDSTSDWSPPTASTFWTTAEPFASATPDACIWWLKAPNNPRLDTPVIVVYGSMPTLTSPRPRAVHNVLGRKDAVVVRDRPKGVQAPIACGARDAAERRRLRDLFAWEGTLLLQAPPEANSGAWGSRYVELGDIVENLPALATIPFDTFTTDVVETGRPAGGIVAFGISYGDLTPEVGLASYGDLKNTFATYADLQGWAQS